jgi:hypothetical protein
VSAMDRAQFGLLLLHAGSLPRLAMQQMLEEITATMAGEDVLDEAAFASQEAAARADLERAADRLEADPTLLPPMHFDFFAGQAMSDEERRRLREEADQADKLAQAQMQAMPGDDMPDGPLDLGAFLARAYAQPLPAARVEAAFARADHAAIAAALARLPADLPSLAAPLDADAMARWLALFRSEDANLEALVEAVVRSEEPA